MSDIVIAIEGVGEVPAAWMDIPFSLECIDCDDGMHIIDFRHAALEGWKYIHADDGPAWNFLGYCSECGPIACGDEWIRKPIIAA